MYKNFIYLIITLSLFIFTAISCDNEDNDISSSDKTDKEIVNDLLNGISTDWGTSSDGIKSHMTGYRIISEDVDFHQYINKNASLIISYNFKDDHLTASTSIIRKINDTNNISSYLDEYTYIGDIDESKIYADINSNTLCVVYDMQFDGTDYTVFGFTPIESDYYTYIDPIVVTTLEASEIGSTSAIIEGNISGIDNSCTCGILYMKGLVWNEKEALKLTTNSQSDFSFKLTGLDIDTDYSYCAFATVDGITYYGEVSVFRTLYVKTYQIGDLYPDETNPEGVVWNVYDNGLHGKIISLDNDYLMWDINGWLGSNANCRNTSDGSYNNLPSGQPYTIWINNHGSGWYGPARGELVSLCDVLYSVNKTLLEHGFEKHEGFYWSSTQYMSDTAYIVCVSESGYMGYSPKWYGYNTKDVNRNVCAMKKF